jgi:outer membrane protein TolC
VTNEYKAGTEDYLSVITAETTLLGDQVSQVSVRTRRMTTSVLLVEALGGGWDVSQMPATANVAGVPQAQAQIDKGNK